MAYNLIGKDFTPPDVRAKVTGSARYAEDIRAEGMVFARLLTSPMPHGRVNRIDTSAAMAMPGVIGVLTADDEGADVLLTNEPKFVGDLILALAATDETTAQDAIDSIVLDIEPLEFTVDPLESLYPGGPDARENGNNVGGGNGGFGDSVDAAQAVSIIYQPLAMRFRGIPVLTNTTPRGPQRGPGQNQIAAALEPFMDRAARELGLDPLELRRINAPTNDTRIGGNQIPVTSAYMPEALDRGAEMFDWQNKRQLSGRQIGSKIYGVGIGQAYHDVGRRGYDGLLVLTPDGMSHLHSGVGNLGTYSYASTTRAAAELLKCDWENCIVHQGANMRHLPIASTQTGSNTCWTMVRTNVVAAWDAIAKLKEIAAMDLGGSPEDYDIGDHRVFATADPSRSMTYPEAAQRAIELGGKFSGEEVPEELHQVTKLAVAGIAGTGLVGVAKDNLRMEGDVPALACGFAAVEVDVETGEVDLVDYVAVADCGTVLHPQGLSQQMKGATVWGIGMALYERQIYDPQNGLPGNIGFEQCKPPTYLDAPSTMAWDAVDLPEPQNPVGTRGIGEPPMGAAAAAIVCAISNALDGHIFNRIPIVPDMIVNYTSGGEQSNGPLQIHTA